MTRHKIRLEGHPARPVGSLLAVSLCLAVGLLLVTAGTALGISGFATPDPAVRAQYPDQSGSQGPQGAQPVFSSLVDVMRVTRRIAREREGDPKAVARFRQTEQVIALKTRSAVLSSAGIDTRQSGSIALLIAGIAVLVVGGALRWRRDLLQV